MIVTSDHVGATESGLQAHPLYFLVKRWFLRVDAATQPNLFSMRAKRKGHPDEGWPLVPNRGLANAYNFPAALGRDPGLFLDSDTGVHLGLYRIAGSWNELSVVAFNGLDGISEHLGDREDVNASCQHIASERIPASSWPSSF
jgi:hypothetical protein